MRYLIIAGTKISTITANSSADAAAKYARRRMPHDAMSERHTLRVIDMAHAEDFAVRLTRYEDHIEAVATSGAFVCDEVSDRKDADHARQP